jgi:hypothetical protein
LCHRNSAFGFFSALLLADKCIKYKDMQQYRPLLQTQIAAAGLVAAEKSVHQHTYPFLKQHNIPNIPI